MGFDRGIYRRNSWFLRHKRGNDGDNNYLRSEGTWSTRYAPSAWSTTGWGSALASSLESNPKSTADAADTKIAGDSLFPSTGIQNFPKLPNNYQTFLFVTDVQLIFNHFVHAWEHLKLFNRSCMKCNWAFLKWTPCITVKHSHDLKRRGLCFLVFNWIISRIMLLFIIRLRKSN